MDERAGTFLEFVQEKYRDDPVGFARDIIGMEPSTQQILALQSVGENKSTAVKSGHGVGKSCLEAIACLWFLTTRPNSTVILTAPSARQLYDVLMREIQLWYNNSVLSELNLFEFTKDKIRINYEKNSKTWFATCVSVSNPENISGGHAEDIFAVVDEGAGVDSEVFVRLEGVLTTAGSKMITCGNPSFTSGYFYDIFHLYQEDYTLFTFNCESSSNVDEEWIDYMKKKYGEESPIYRVRVLGEFAPMNENVIIDRKYLQGCFTEERASRALEDPFLVNIGVDVASGESDDKSVISVRSGQKEIYREMYSEKLSDFQDLLVDVIEKYRGIYENVVVNMDTTGLGFQLGQDVQDLYSLYEEVTINRINFSSSAVEKEVYHNIVTEMFFRFKEDMDSISLIHSDALEEELSARRFDLDLVNRFRAEKKREYIKRVGRSPDEGDAVLLAFYEPIDQSLIEGYMKR